MGVVALAACGGDVPAAPVPGGPTAASSATVEIERSRYLPDEIDVAAGGSIAFVNLDPVDHTVTAADDSTLSFDSGAYGEGESFTQRFDEVGTYNFFCEIHPTMRATVTVT